MGDMGGIVWMGCGSARARESITIDFSPVPSTTNPLGAKGAGEGGTVASTPAVMNAILDALAPHGAVDVPMPATPERIWRTLQDRAGLPASGRSSLADQPGGGNIRSGTGPCLPDRIRNGVPC